MEIMMKRIYFLFGLLLLLVVGSISQVHQYSVTMTQVDYDSLFSRDIWSDVYLNATFASSDSVWNGAKIKFKGHSTRYYPKKAYRVRFATSKLFYKVRDANFNAMYTDKSFMREKLAWDLFADMKAVAPFCYHSNFSINGESKGLFSFIDKVDKYFLANRGFTLGSLYEANDTWTLADLTVQPDSILAVYYDLNNGSSYDDLKSFIQTINDAPDSLFYQTVVQLIDTNSVLNWFCANTLTMMGDSYNKNYNLFRDTTRPSQQWIIVPWDYDLSWGRSGDLTKPYPSSLLNDGFAYTYPPLSGPSNVLKDRWMATPRLMEMFRSRLRYLLDSIYTEERYHKKIDSLKSLIENDVAADNYKWGTMQDFYEHANALKYFITVRRNYLYKTFINSPSGMYNIVTLPISQVNVPYHFITYDGRTIATMWFTSINGLDSINVRAYPDSTPPFISNPVGGRFIKRWLKITPYPSNAQFTAKLQFMYSDRQADDREVGPGVQDERLLRAGFFNGSFYESLPTKINSFANTVTIDQINETQVGYDKYISIMISDSYTQKWYKQQNYFWHKLYDVKFTDRQNGFAIGDHGIFLKTTDGGFNWAESWIGNNLPFYGLANPTQNVFFVVGENGSLFNSANGGTIWQKLTFSNKKNIRAISMNYSQPGWIAGDMGFVASTIDSGKTWDETIVDSTKNFYGVAVFPDWKVVLAGDNGTVFISTDSVNGWEQKYTGLTANLRAVKIIDNQMFITGDSGTVITSSDRGATWQNVSVPFDINLKDIFLMSNQSIYVVGDGGKIFYTNNGGASWYSQYSADSHNLTAVTFVDSSYGIAVGNDGTVLKTTETATLTGFRGTLADIPNEFKLYQNFPNPFNPTTHFGFRISGFGFVNLKVYDLLGREVATLVNEVKQPGEYTVRWDASNLSSGVYFYRLTVGDKFAETKKLLLLK
jgi:spore coat protein CotH/photosystem II stability/assembly factor-like uncharacterized protein